MLELGAGVGLVGFVCASLGAKSVAMTDRDDATLALMHVNARLNGYHDASSSGDRAEVSIDFLDWGDARTYLDPPNVHDYVVASDVLYLPEHCAAFPDAVAGHLKPGGRLVVACGLRRAGLMEQFVEGLERKIPGVTVAIDRSALSLESEDVDATAIETAAEHAHDGAQIAAAGGYALVICDAPKSWTPEKRRLSETRSERLCDAFDECRAENEKRLRVFQTTSRATAPGSPRSGRPSRSESIDAKDDDLSSEASLGEASWDAASAMGDFLEDFAELDVEEDARRNPSAKEPLGETSLESSPSEASFPPHRVAVSREELEAKTLSARTAAEAAASLATNGFVVLDPPGAPSEGLGLISREALKQAEVSTMAWLAILKDRARRSGAGIDPERDIFRFREVCSRARLGKRFDVTADRRGGGRDGTGGSSSAAGSEDGAIGVSPGGPPEARAAADAASRAWDRIRRESDPWISPVFAASGLGDAERAVSKDGEARCSGSGGVGVGVGVTTATGCVVSFPGAPAQHFHADGRARGIANCFVPLVDVPPELGPTRFLVGSHAWGHDDPYPTRSERRRMDLAPEVAPPLGMGSVLVYDYRVMHAGGANASETCRPVCYVTRSRRGVEDTWNFPETSIWE